VPHANSQRARKQRLLRLMLLQIAILSIANGCTRSSHYAFDPPAQAAPRHRYVESRFVPTDLTESLDRMADRGADPRRAIFPLSVEHTATSRLDTGRLVVEEVAP
jgi:hypothetical protein